MLQECFAARRSFGMMKRSRRARAQILGLTVEGMLLRTISRITGASKNTVVKMTGAADEALSDHQDRALRGLIPRLVDRDSFAINDVRYARGLAGGARQTKTLIPGRAQRDLV